MRGLGPRIPIMRAMPLEARGRGKTRRRRTRKQR
jgi:hypothetical protein